MVKNVCKDSLIISICAKENEFGCDIVPVHNMLYEDLDLLDCG